MGFIGDIVEGVVDFFEDVFEAVVDVFSSIFSAIGSAVSGLFGGLTPDVPTPNSGATSPGGVVITKAGSNLDIPVVYGYRRVGGRILFAETNGTNNENLYVVYAICEGEIEGIKKIHIDDTELPKPPGGTFAVGNTTTHHINSGRYSGRLSLQVFNGTETQDQSTLAKQSKSWGNQLRKLPGVAYAVMEYKWKKIETQEDADNNPYRGGIPSVKFDVKGKKVFNVITHSGGENLSSNYAGLTKTFSYNPVSCTLDFLMNTRYGAGIDRTEINADAFKTAAIKCNQEVTYATGQTGKALTMNAVVSMQPKIIDNVKTLLSGCRGFLPYIQGRYKLILEDGGNATDITSSTVTSAFDVTTDHIIGSISMQGEQKANKFNQVIVRYVDPDKNFTEQQTVHTESADVTADGEDLIGDFQFFTISNPNIAQDLARMIYKKSRSQRFISFTATPELLAVEPGDVIRVSSDVLNLSTQTFRVTNMNFTGGGNVEIQAREHDATLYPFVTGNQIEIPAKLYRPDTFVITPTPGSPTRSPISVAPPDDPEQTVTDPTQDSTGTPTGKNPSDSNDDLPEAPDNANPKVTAFNTWTGRFSPTQPSTTLPQQFGTSSSCLLFQPDILTDSTTTSLRQTYKTPFDAQPSPGGQLIFKILRPFGFIDTLRLYHFNRQNKTLIETIDRPLSVVPGSQHVLVFLNNLTTQSFIRPKFYFTAEDQLYDDGSTTAANADLSVVRAPTYSAFSFVDLEGRTQSGFNLEAAINNYLQNDTTFRKFAADAGSSTSSSSSSESLGG